jgi:hypothetical protein
MTEWKLPHEIWITQATLQFAGRDVKSDPVAISAGDSVEVFFDEVGGKPVLTVEREPEKPS